jgi:hypothetical protein
MRSNPRDEPLWDTTGPRHPAGRVRRGLDADVKQATAGGASLAAAGVAACRSLADQIDQAERQLREPGTKPYDRVPLAGLVREFNDTYERLFAAVQRAEDPLTRALADFAAADAERRAARAAAAGDTA